MLDVISLTQTQIKEENQVEMITSIICEKIHDTLVNDNTEVIKLILHQAFPIEITDILIERVDCFHVAISFIHEFLMASLTYLDPIFQEDPNDQKDDDMQVDKENQFYLLPEHYKLIYRTVFFYRILARLSEKFMFQELQEKAKIFMKEVSKLS
jgi:hypothetical protein